MDLPRRTTAALIALLLPLSSFAQAVSKCPNVLVVFDDSGSMSDNQTTSTDGGLDTRLNVARAAVSQLVSNAAAGNLRFGLEVFGLNTGGNACSISGATCSYQRRPPASRWRPTT